MQANVGVGKLPSIYIEIPFSMGKGSTKHQKTNE